MSKIPHKTTEHVTKARNFLDLVGYEFISHETQLKPREYTASDDLVREVRQVWNCPIPTYTTCSKCTHDTDNMACQMVTDTQRHRNARMCRKAY